MDQNDIKDTIEKVKDRATDFSGSNSRKGAKGIVGIIIVLLLGGLGLELSNNDWDLGSIFSGQSVSDSKILRDEAGNVARDADGNIITRILRDKQGNVAAEGQAGAKYTDEYNCEDFTTQPEAQAFFVKAGGLRADTNRLDGDKDGEACEALPKGN